MTAPDPVQQSHPLLPVVLLQIPVDAAPGSNYGRYFHHLLLKRDLLLLGLYRQVDQDGLTFRATITNPHYQLTLQARAPLLLDRLV